MKSNNTCFPLIMELTMEKRERPPAPPARRRGHKNPSFSSSLLDAIYRSIDDSEGGTPRLCFSAEKQQRNTGDENLIPPQHPPLSQRHTRDPANDRCHRRFFSTSGSSDCSSFGGFSSSEADSTARPRTILTRSDRIRNDPQPPPPPPVSAEKKRPGGSIGSRIRDLRKSKSPASPGSRLTAFLNTIFAAAAGSPKNTKFADGGEEPECSLASSYSRSRVKKSASSSKGGSSSKQPSLVKIAVDEKRYSGREAAVASEAAEHRRKLMEKLLRGIEMEEESDCESVSSSDLFELESLSVIGRFTDELPVFETTNYGANRAIAHGLVL